MIQSRLVSAHLAAPPPYPSIHVAKSGRLDEHSSNSIADAMSQSRSSSLAMKGQGRTLACPIPADQARNPLPSIQRHAHPRMQQGRVYRILKLRLRKPSNNPLMREQRQRANRDTLLPSLLKDAQGFALVDDRNCHLRMRNCQGNRRRLTVIEAAGQVARSEGAEYLLSFGVHDLRHQGVEAGEVGEAEVVGGGWTAIAPHRTTGRA
jgi:hypothetical protein